MLFFDCTGCIFFDLCINTKEYKCFNEKNRILVEKNNDIKSITLFDNYPFIQWISKLPKWSIEKNIVLKMFSDHYKPIINPEYSYKNQEALGLGYAYKNKLIALSYSTSEELNTCNIEIDSLVMKNENFQEEKS